VYVKVVNGQVVCVGLPTCGMLTDGRCVSNYNLLSPEILQAEGWLPLELNQPEYNPATQELQLDGYMIQTNKVIANYTAVDIVRIPTIEERLECAEAVLMDMIEIMMV
jgi:hypothetical protein